MFASQRTIDAIALIHSAQQSATTDLCHWCGDNSICHDDDDDDDDRLVAQSCCPFHIDSFTHLISFCVFVLYLLLYMITMVRWHLSPFLSLPPLTIIIIIIYLLLIGYLLVYSTSYLFWRQDRLCQIALYYNT